MVFASPSQRFRVEVWQPPYFNGAQAGIDLAMPSKSIRLLTATQEGIIYFVHVYWSPDESRVGIVGTGYTIFHLAYDIRNDRELPFSDVSAEVARSISASYSLPPKESDPIQWAAMNDAQLQFRKKYPTFRPTYMK